MSDSLDPSPSATLVRLDGPGGLVSLRRRVRGMLADCPASVVIDVVLLADGLGAAACEHGIAPFDVRLFRSGPGRVRVEVEPIPGRPDLGLGARVLDSVSTRWGFGPDGLLWAERELDDISRS